MVDALSQNLSVIARFLGKGPSSRPAGRLLTDPGAVLMLQRTAAFTVRIPRSAGLPILVPEADGRSAKVTVEDDEPGPGDGKPKGAGPGAKTITDLASGLRARLAFDL